MANRTSVVKLNNTAWTALTTTETNVLIQNSGGSAVLVAFADAPGDLSPTDLGHPIGGGEAFSPPMLAAGVKAYARSTSTDYAEVVVTKF